MRAGSAVAGAAGWALFLAVVAADCAMDGVALTDTSAVATAGKLSPDLSARRVAEQDRPVLVLIRTAGPVTERELGALRSAGVVLETVAGSVVSGRVAVRSLQAVAALDFVRYVEPGRRLAPEEEKRP